VQIAALTGALHARCQAITLARAAAQTLVGMADVDGIATCAEPVAEAVHALMGR
jgi:hypothetical protein